MKFLHVECEVKPLFFDWWSTL